MSASDRLLELLVERSDRELAPGERAELVRLLSDSDAEYGTDDIELAAGAIALAELGAEEGWEEAQMPDDLFEAVGDAAKVQLVAAPPPLEPMPEPGVPRPSGVTAPPPLEPMPKPGSRPWLAYAGWAAAAALALAFVGGRGGPDEPEVEGDALAATAPSVDCPVCPTPPAPPKPEPSVDEKAEALEQAPETLRLAWARTEDPLAGAAEGEVIWNGERQEGYMRFAGLPVNDPTKQQYQLWIFDKGRSDATPVDGGVFDVNADGGVIVAIDPKVAVDEAVMFAVTVERPGGVVVSKREHIVTLAKLG